MLVVCQHGINVDIGCSSNVMVPSETCLHITEGCFRNCGIRPGPYRCATIRMSVSAPNLTILSLELCLFAVIY